MELLISVPCFSMEWVMSEIQYLNTLTSDFLPPVSLPYLLKANWYNGMSITVSLPASIVKTSWNMT